MSREAYSPPQASNWQATSIKLILFPVQPQHRERREWWKEITSKEPDQCVRKKDDVTESGLLAPSRQLEVSVNFVKMDIELSAVQRKADEADGPLISFLGPLAELTGEFFDLLMPWLRHAPPIKRIGFAASLAHPAASRGESYLLLDRMLATVDVDPASSDFQYRINRKTATTAVPVGVLVNRLAAWSSQRIGRSLIAVSPEGMETRPFDEEVNFTALVLDVNTDQSRTQPFAAESLEGLCREFAALALKIVTEGDRREL